MMIKLHNGEAYDVYEFLDGMLDEVRLYDRALNAVEIKMLAQAP